MLPLIRLHRYIHNNENKIRQLRTELKINDTWIYNTKMPNILNDIYRNETFPNIF